jgi:hypothetical protein
MSRMDEMSPRFSIIRRNNVSAACVSTSVVAREWDTMEAPVDLRDPTFHLILGSVEVETLGPNASLLHFELSVMKVENALGLAGLPTIVGF